MIQKKEVKLQKNNPLKLFNSILKENKIKNLLEELKDYHPETYEHCLRVGLFCMKMGGENNLSKDKIKILGISGLLHDIGKLDIPKKILSKKEKLTKEERKKIEEHCTNGFLRLKDFKNIRNLILQHHQHQINNYPKNCKIQKQDDKLVQIICIVDTCDALSHTRIYRKKLENKKIRKILEKEFTGDKIYIEQVLELSKDGEKRSIQV